METYQVIQLSPSTKEEAELFASKLTAEVEAGNVNALTLFIKINAIVKSLDTVKKNISEYALSEAEKFGANKFETQGAEVSISELGTKYNFSICCDPVWDEANEQVEQWDAKKKERETFLKTIKDSLDIIIEGEPMKILSPQKSSTTGIRITLK